MNKYLNKFFLGFTDVKCNFKHWLEHLQEVDSEIYEDFWICLTVPLNDTSFLETRRLVFDFLNGLEFGLRE